MCNDMRKAARIPFGYRIVDGRAQVDETEAEKLRKYFDLYLAGSSMAEAAREAGLQCSATTFRNLLKRKEYTGTDYYPAIITSDYQAQLMTELEKRRGDHPRKVKERIPKGVVIHTEFKLSASRKATDDLPLPDQMNALYQQIRPKYKKKTSDGK